LFESLYSPYLSVFVVACDSVALRKLMLVAHTLGMTNGDYVFLYYEGFRGIELGNISWKKGDANDNVNIIIICNIIPMHRWSWMRRNHMCSLKSVRIYFRNWQIIHMMLNSVRYICHFIFRFKIFRADKEILFFFINNDIINLLNRMWKISYGIFEIRIGTNVK
jgi:hypothetical protein